MAHITLFTFSGHPVPAYMKFIEVRDEWGHVVRNIGVFRFGTGKCIGRISIYSHGEDTHIAALKDKSGKEPSEKVLMGRLFRELAIAEYVKAGSKTLSANVEKRHWNFMDWGFAPTPGFIRYSMWRFEDAEEIFHKLQNRVQLDPPQLSEFLKQRQLLASDLGVSTESLSAREVCLITDVADEMQRIFARASTQNRIPRPIAWPMMEMCLSEKAVKKTKQMMLSSPFPQNTAVLSKLQLELLEDFRQKGVPQRVFDLVTGYSED